MGTTEANDPLVGQVLGGRFRVEALMDKGGMGKIYRAIQEPLGREVALKTLDIVDREGRYQQRFFLEASALARLSHPNTVRVLDYGSTDDGIYYFAMEFLKGADLYKVLRADGALPAARIIRVLDQVAGALAEAHAAGIVHRDLKPANVYLTRHGDTLDHVKVIDFGLVKELGHDGGLSISGQVMGTPDYMAPEQVEGGELAPQTDVYALGVMLFECLTGRVPFQGKTSLATLMMHLNEPPPAVREIAPEIEAPSALVWLMERCLSKAPSQRPRDMREVSRVLRIAARQLQGELPDDLSLRLRNGQLVLPAGVTEEAMAPLPSASGAHAIPSAPRSAVRTAAVGFGVATAVIVLLAVLGIGLVVAAGAGAAGAWYAAAPAEVPTRPVLVESQPAGAMVRIDGNVVGHTPYEVQVPEGGTTTIEVKQPGYKLGSRTLDGSEGRIELQLVEKPGKRASP